MKSTKEFIAAFTAGMLAVSLAGCGSVEEENKAGAAQTASEAETAEVLKNDTADSSESENTDKTEIANETTGDVKISAAAGFENYVNFTPAADEMSALAQLAREQYNAVLGKDPEAYFRTLNIRAPFENGDFDKFRKLSQNAADSSACYDYFGFVSSFESILWDWACFDDPSLLSESSWEDEDGGDVTQTIYQKALDGINADFFKNADPFDKNLAGMEIYASYFYPDYNSDSMEGFKPVSDGAVCSGVELFSAFEYNGCRCIEFSADFTNGGETVHIPYVRGWIKDGEKSVLTFFEEATMYCKDTSVELSKEDEQAIMKLGAEQYNAIVTRDAEAYLKTVNLDKSLEGLSKEEIVKRWESYDCDLPMGFDLMLDCATYKDPSLKEPFHNDELLAEKYDNSQQNAARVWYEAAAELNGKITPEILEEMDKDEAIRGELVSNYFTDYDYLCSKNEELAPVAIEDVFTDDVIADTNDDGSIFVSMYLRYKDGEETHFIGRAEGCIKDGKMCVYLYDIIPDGGEEENIDDANRGD